MTEDRPHNKYTPDRYKDIKEARELTQQEAYNKLISGLLGSVEDNLGR